MNNFIHSLRAKAAELKSERDQLLRRLDEGQKRLSTLNGAIAGIDQLLQLEGADPTPESHGKQVNGSGDSSLADILKRLLSDRKYHAPEELVAAAKANGFDFGGKREIPSVNFTLMGLQRAGDFERDSNGRWRFTG
ncbi:MAG: hypothetical protein ACRD2L_22130 [Terriglobia bacterium]